MSAHQQELFIVENLIKYRSFGFCAALLERVPLAGLLFSISNRIGAAMWAHDLEKRQHAFGNGEVQRTRKYISKNAGLEAELPDEFAGGFPLKKGPVQIEKVKRGSPLELEVKAPPLPPRRTPT